MISSLQIKGIVNHLASLGWQDDIEWSENVKPPSNSLVFAREAIWVICNSGMKHTIAKMIFDRVIRCLYEGRPASDGFGHKGKVAAIQEIWDNQEELYRQFMDAPDKLEFCLSLPWIGNITKYHLAKNFGVDVAKPDVHLQRLADHAGTDPHTLCDTLAKETGYRVATIDLILWRACATGVINSRTGELFLPLTPEVETA